MKRKSMFLTILLFSIILLITILSILNINKYDKIELPKEPDGIFSSMYTDKLAVIIDGKLTVYDDEGNALDVVTGGYVKFAYPLENSIYVITENYNLYELAYDNVNGITDDKIILTDVKYFTYCEDSKNSTFSCGAVTNNGDLFVWGSNENYILGIKDEKHIDEPTKVAYLSEVEKVYFFRETATLLTESGDVYQAGLECSHTKEIYLKEFEKIESISGAKDINFGDAGMIFTDKQIVYWLFDSYTYTDEMDEYVKACEKIPFVQFSQNDSYWLGVTSSGTVYFRGYDWAGGILSDEPCLYNEPTEVKGIRNAESVHVGDLVAYVKKGKEIIILK